MSPSKPATSKTTAGAKSKTKAKAKPAAAAKRSTVETLRIIPAPQPATLPDTALSTAEKARSAQASALAGEIEKALSAGGNQAVVLDPQAVQALLASLCKVYSQHVENLPSYDAFSHKNPVTPTDVMVTASGLLKAANLAVFELGMWQSWTGR